jgi:hypothetical protein
MMDIRRVAAGGILAAAVLVNGVGSAGAAPLSRLSEQHATVVIRFAVPLTSGNTCVEGDGNELKVCFKINGTGDYVTYFQTTGYNQTSGDIYGQLNIEGPNGVQEYSSGIPPQYVNSGSSMSYNPVVDADLASGVWSAYFEELEMNPQGNWVTEAYAGPAQNTISS